MGVGGQPHAPAASVPGKDPVPIVQEAGWAPGPVWTGGKSRHNRDSIPDRPARTQSLYRLNYPANCIAVLKICISLRMWTCGYSCNVFVISSPMANHNCKIQQIVNLKVCHPRCVGSIIQSYSMYLSIYTYSHEHNNITISSDI